MSGRPFRFVVLWMLMSVVLLSGAAGRSERPSEGESGLLSELLGAPAGALGTGQTATLTALACLTQAGAHVRAYQVLVDRVHLGVL